MPLKASHSLSARFGRLSVPTSPHKEIPPLLVGNQAEAVLAEPRRDPRHDGVGLVYFTLRLIRNLPLANGVPGGAEPLANGRIGSGQWGNVVVRSAIRRLKK